MKPRIARRDAVARAGWFVLCGLFAPGSGFVGGLDKAMLAGVGRDALTGTVPGPAFVLFQLTLPRW